MLITRKMGLYYASGRPSEEALSLLGPQRNPQVTTKAHGCSMVLQLLQHHWDTHNWATPIKEEMAQFCSPMVGHESQIGKHCIREKSKTQGRVQF